MPNDKYNEIQFYIKDLHRLQEIIFFFTLMAIRTYIKCFDGKILYLFFYVKRLPSTSVISN